MFSRVATVSLILMASAVARAAAVSPTPSPTAASTATQFCIGDCNGDGTVRVNELIIGVNVVMGNVELSACPAIECPQLLGVYISCGIEAVLNALSGCPNAPLVTPTPMPADYFPTPYALSSLDEHCGDETGAGLLAGVRPEYAATLAPRSETGWPDAIPFSLRLTYTGGAITCYPRYVPPPYSKRPVIFEQVGLAMQVEFDTADGRFAEQAETELKGGSRGGTLSFSRRPEEIQGTYRPQLPGYEDVQVGIWGNFFGDWTNGGIGQSGQRPGHASEYIPLAYWQQPKTDPPPHR